MATTETPEIDAGDYVEVEIPKFNRYSDAQLLAALARVERDAPVEELGQSSYQLFAPDHYPSATTIRDRFDTWGAAREAAAEGPDPDDDWVIDRLKQTSCKRSEQVRDVIETLHQEGETYIKAKDIADRTDQSTKQVGSSLAVLQGDAVERWGRGRRSTTWRITIDEGGAD